MGKQSAGILVHRQNNGLEVLIVHPGGPFWAKKDKGAWSIPKGEFEDGDPLEAAKREFKEETGFDAPTGDYKELGSVKNKSNKVVFAWAVEGNLDASQIISNKFQMEWPPKSGQQQEFQEVDRAAWVRPEKAIEKLNAYQAPLIDRLAGALGVRLDKPEQTSLL